MSVRAEGRRTEGQPLALSRGSRDRKELLVRSCGGQATPLHELRCGAGLAEWRMQRIEQLVQPTEAQKTALSALRDASTKAAEQISAACPREFPASATARMELMEKRMETMLAALKTVRPAFDAFYATLSDEQKAKLDRGGPRRWGWRNWGPRNQQ